MTKGTQYTYQGETIEYVGIKLINCGRPTDHYQFRKLNGEKLMFTVTEWNNMKLKVVN